MAGRSEPPSMDRWVAPAAGVAAVALGVGLAELTAALLAPGGSPVLAVGAALIDLAPSWAKDLAIALFGTGDKIALLVGVALVLAALAAGAGVLERRNPPWGRLLVGVGAVAGLAAVVTRASFSPLDAVPTLVAAIVSIVSLAMLLRRAPEPADSSGPDRRSFLSWSLGALALGALGSAGAGALQLANRAATAARELFTLPAPAVTAAPIPPGAELGIRHVAPLVTPTDDFYRIDTALRVPVIDPSAWRLRIHGAVAQPFELSWDELIALPLEESYTTLMCVSNEVGGDLIGTAKWLGYPIRELLARARPQAGADMVLSTSADGWTAGTPLEVLREGDRNAILAIGMNDEPLPLEHGFPARLVVPGLYGYVSATKWVVDLEVTRFADASAYWTDRGWSARGPIKLHSRIDVPSAGQYLDPGPVTIAGVAWHQHTGVAGVEIQVDDGPWQPATLATAISADTWVQWRFVWDAVPGDHTARVRATSASGEVQTEVRQGVIPDGATGLHSVLLRVA